MIDLKITDDMIAHSKMLIKKIIMLKEVYMMVIKENNLSVFLQKILLENF